MTRKEESPAGKQGQSLDRSKDTNNNRIKWLLRKVLTEGGRYTAKELNALTGQNDSRKRMSQLRREGMNIRSKWIDNPRCKLYWLVPDDQPTLFGKDPRNG